jgi:hypothetical protein
MSKQVLCCAYALGVVLAGCGVAEDAQSAEAEPLEIGLSESALQYCESSCTGWGDSPISCTTTSCTAYSSYIVCDGQVRYCRCAAPLSIGVSASKYYAYNENVTITANVPAGGPYSYTWTQSWCRNGTAPGDCNGSSTTFSAGQSISKYISRYDVWVSFCVRATDTTCSSRVSNSACVTIYGAGECPPNMTCRL